MAFRCSAGALAVALVTGFPSNALAEAQNSTMVARGLRGSLGNGRFDRTPGANGETSDNAGNGGSPSNGRFGRFPRTPGANGGNGGSPSNGRFSCKSKDAQCGTNGRRTALCCSGLKCEPWLGSFEMRCVDAPAPSPARNTCEEIGCGSQGKTGDACECIEECLLRGTCCSDFNSVCKSGPTPAPGPPASTPAPTPGPAPAPQQVELSWSFDSFYCMSVDSNVFQNGQKMQLWQCSGSIGQMFQFDTSSDSPSVLRVSAATQYCVVIDGNKNENGARIQLWDCDLNVQAQHWTRQWVCPSYVSSAECRNSDPQTRAVRGDSQLLRNYAFPDKCLVVDSNKGANGQKLQIWSCDEAAQQYQTWKHNDF